ncbi:hypothetical protein HED63_16100 [Ochrobactrum cytisi]|nr:hypothetical protein [Brucella cytisi]
MKDKTATSAFIDRIPYMSFLFLKQRSLSKPYAMRQHNVPVRNRGALSGNSGMTMDFAVLSIGIGFFALLFGYLRICERL